VDSGSAAGYDFDRSGEIPMSDANRCRSSCATGEFDRYAQDFWRATPTRWWFISLRPRCRALSGSTTAVEWYDLDFPHVIELPSDVLRQRRMNAGVATH